MESIVNERSRINDSNHQTSALQERMDKIEKSIKSLRKLLIVSGSGNSDVAAREALNESKEQLARIQRATDDLNQQAQDSCEHLQKVAENSANWISEAMQSLDIEHFRHLIFDNVETVEAASQSAIKRIQKLVRWFHWEKVGLAFLIAVLVVFLAGLFINDEFPWESHQRVSAERKAGTILLRAWPNLTLREKQNIEQASRNYV